MSALNVFMARDRVSILVDTAGYGQDGRLIRFVAKANALPHVPAVFAARGSWVVPFIFAPRFGERFATFDEMVTDGAQFADEIHADSYQFIASSGEENVDLVMAGWSESRDRPEAYVLTSFGRNGLSAWQFYPITEAVALPGPSEEAAIAAGFVEKDQAHYDPATDGLKLMQAQRSMRWPVISDSDAEEEHHLVGGAAVLIEVTKAGINQRIIHRWNDKVGEHIRPEPLIVRPTATVGLSRQQRRAMARQMSKVS